MPTYLNCKITSPFICYLIGIREARGVLKVDDAVAVLLDRSEVYGLDLRRPDQREPRQAVLKMEKKIQMSFVPPRNLSRLA